MNNWELTNEEIKRLSEENRKKYDRAKSFKNHDWANGPYGGWVRGNDLLKELGWEEKTIIKGHRSFISMIKPHINGR